MQDCAVRLHDDFLKWESERQNRMRQEARQTIEQKNIQKRADEAERSAPQPVKHPAQADAEIKAGAMPEEAYLVRHIPEMRSALMPLEDGRQDGWSHPFSLAKADMEPWLSFFGGYKKSRLFLDSKASGQALAVDGSSELPLDFAVRAMLELTQLDAKIILEPPVRINGETHYLDLAAELRICRDPVRAKSLTGMAKDIHANQLASAFAKGREMGDRLHEAWMGEGYANLIDAWIQIIGRQPTVEELHLMFSTGRLKPIAKKSQPLSEAVEVRDRNPPMVVERIRQRPKQTEKPAADPFPEEPDAIVALSTPAAQTTGVQEQKKPPVRPILMRLFHITLCCAAIAAYAMFI